MATTHGRAPGEKMSTHAERSPAAVLVAERPSKERGAPRDRFSDAHERHCDGVWRCLRRLGLTPSEADDATQQVFLVFSQRLPEVRPGAERSFLYAVATRIAFDIRRRAGRRYEVADSTEHVAPGAEPDHLLEERECLSLLDRILDSLGPDLRQVFVLYELEELSMKEIASILEIPAGTVASRLRRAREEWKRASALHRKGQNR